MCLNLTATGTLIDVMFTSWPPGINGGGNAGQFNWTRETVGNVSPNRPINTFIYEHRNNSVTFDDQFIKVVNDDNLYLNDSIVAVNSSAEIALDSEAEVIMQVGSCDEVLAKTDGFYTDLDVAKNSPAQPCDTCSINSCENNLMNFTTTEFSTIFSVNQPNITIIAPNATNGSQAKEYNNFEWIWNVSVAGPSGNDFGEGIDVDSSDNVIVTGNKYSGLGNNDLWLLKYDNSGTHLWNTTFSGVTDDYGYGVVVDSNNNITVVGKTESFGAGGFDAIIARYDSSGTHLWNTTWGGGLNDIANKIDVDSSDNLIVVGETKSFGPGDSDIFVVKYDNSGTQLWNKSIGSTNYDVASDVIVDSSDNIILTGVHQPTSLGLFVVKFDSSGTQLWNKTLNANSAGYGIDIDSSDNIITTGWIDDGSWGDVITVKFDSSGTQLWNSTLVFTNAIAAKDLVVDSNNNITLVGSHDTIGSESSSVYLIKYDSSGSPLWNYTWISSLDDEGKAIVLDSNEDYLITGEKDDDILIGKLSQDLVVLENVSYNASVIETITFNVTAQDADSSALTFTWVIEKLGSVLYTFSELVSKVLGVFTGTFDFLFDNASDYNVTLTVNDSSHNDSFLFEISSTCIDEDGDGFNTSDGNTCGVVDCNDNDASIRPPMNEEFVNDDVLFCSGWYNLPLGIEINASNIDIVCNDTTLNGSESSDGGIWLYNKSNVMITGCSIHNYLFGMEINNTLNINITDNYFESNLYYGIQVVDTNYSYFTNLSASSSNGIFLSSSHHNYVDDFNGVNAGLFINFGNNNTVNNVEIINQQSISTTNNSSFTNLSFIGFGVGFSLVAPSKGNNIHNLLIENSGGIALNIDTGNNTIDSFIVRNTSSGVYIPGENNTFRNGVIENTTGFGLTFGGSHNLIYNVSLVNSGIQDIASFGAYNNTYVVLNNGNTVTYDYKYLNVIDVDNLYFNDSIISVDSVADSDLNVTANVTLNVAECPIEVATTNGFYNSTQTANAAGLSNCTECDIISCSGNTLVMNVNSFSTVIAANIPPIVNTIQPTTVNENDSVNFNTTVYDNVGVTSCNLYVDGVDQGAMDISGSFTNKTISLTPPGIYELIANCSDALGNYNDTSNTSVTVLDVTPPIITNIVAIPSYNSATITWDTNEAANSSVDYNITNLLELNGYSITYVTSHSIILSGLNSETLYYFNVTSCDSSDNCVTNGTLNFTTTSRPSSSSSSSSSSSKRTVNSHCTFMYVCDEWSSCVDGVQTRICNDVNPDSPNCGPVKTETQQCAVVEEPTEPGLDGGIVGDVIEKPTKPIVEEPTSVSLFKGLYQYAWLLILGLFVLLVLVRNIDTFPVVLWKDRKYMQKGERVKAEILYDKAINRFSSSKKLERKYVEEVEELAKQLDAFEKGQKIPEEEVKPQIAEQKQEEKVDYNKSVKVIVSENRSSLPEGNMTPEPTYEEVLKHYKKVFQKYILLPKAKRAELEPILAKLRERLLK